MRKLIILLMMVIITTTTASAQVAINSTGASANASAALDVSSTTKGFLPPRVALTSTTSASPLAAHVAGMVVYNTATVSDVVPGLYVDNGTAWVTTAANANVNIIQVSLTGTVSPTNANPVSFNETLFSKGSDLVLNANGSISGLKVGKTYRITAHISGRGVQTSNLATYFIYDYTSNAIIGEKLEFISNSYAYTYSQKPSGISYITPTVNTTVGLRSASAGNNYNIGTYTTFSVEELH